MRLDGSALRVYPRCTSFGLALLMLRRKNQTPTIYSMRMTTRPWSCLRLGVLKTEAELAFSCVFSFLSLMYLYTMMMTLLYGRFQSFHIAFVLFVSFGWEDKVGGRVLTPVSIHTNDFFPFITHSTICHPQSSGTFLPRYPVLCVLSLYY